VRKVAPPLIAAFGRGVRVHATARPARTVTAIEPDAPLDHVDRHVLDQLALQRGAVPQLGFAFFDRAVGLHGNHPGGLRNGGTRIPMVHGGLPTLGAQAGDRGLSLALRPAYAADESR
jgi:hypothetical protein